MKCVYWVSSRTDNNWWYYVEQIFFYLYTNFWLTIHPSIFCWLKFIIMANHHHHHHVKKKKSLLYFFTYNDSFVLYKRKKNTTKLLHDDTFCLNFTSRLKICVSRYIIIDILKQKKNFHILKLVNLTLSYIVK